MKIEQTPRDDHQVNVIAECSQEELAQFSEKAARKISSEAKIPGFRPGKAPTSVIRRMYGDEYIQNRAIELMVDDIYPKIIDETKIKPSGPGSLENVISTDPPKFSFIIPLEPEVDLKDYLSIRKPYSPPSLDEKEVTKTLNEFQRMMAIAEPVERAAAVGDMVYMKLKGVLLDPSEGEDLEVVKETDTQVWIGNEPEEDPFPFKGFEKTLIGLAAEDEKSVEHKYSKDYRFQELQGKTVKYDVKVLSIKYMKLPELNDDFARSLGDFENYQALVDSVRSRLNERTVDEYDQKYYDELLEEITAQAVIKYPPQMLEEESEHLLDHFKQDLAEQKLDLETYLKLQNKEMTSFISEEITPAAKRRLERSLVLEQIAKSQNIKLSQDEITQELNATLSSMQGSKEFEKLTRKSNSQQLMNAMAVQAASRAMNRRVLTTIKTIATGEYQAPDTSASTEDSKPEKGKRKPSSSKAKSAETSADAVASKPSEKPKKKSKEKNEE